MNWKTRLSAWALALGVASAPAAAGAQAFDEAIEAYGAALRTGDKNLIARARDDLYAIVKDTPAPPEDLAPPSERAGLEGCRSDALYWGYDGEPDHVRARWCAWNGELSNAGSIFDPGVLMQVYANGEGVARNWPLAFHFAGKLDPAPAEAEARTQHLYELMRGVDIPADRGYAPGRIGMCDDITSGRMSGVCAQIPAGIANGERERSLAEMTAGLEPRQRAAWNALYEQTGEFCRAHSANEVDMSGSSRGAFFTEAQTACMDDLEQTLSGLMTGELPVATPEDAERSDAKLNDAYRQAMRSAAFQENPDSPGFSKSYGTILWSGVQETQRAWLAYRDAWLDFAETVDPQRRTTLLDFLTRTRAAALQELLEG